MNKTNRAGIFFFCICMLLMAPAASLALEIGDKAPPFVGNATQGKIQLTDYLGKKNVVLALYFAAFTPV
jgi:hypothetical protein